MLNQIVLVGRVLSCNTKQDGDVIGEYYVTSRGNVWYWNPNGLSF